MIYSKQHPKRKERDFWVIKNDPLEMEKLLAIGISLKFCAIELMSWRPEDLDVMFNELREDLPE